MGSTFRKSEKLRFLLKLVCLIVFWWFVMVLGAPGRSKIPHTFMWTHPGQVLPYQKSSRDIATSAILRGRGSKNNRMSRDESYTIVVGSVLFRTATTRYANEPKISICFRKLSNTKWPTTFENCFRVSKKLGSRLPPPLGLWVWFAALALELLKTFKV